MREYYKYIGDRFPDLKGGTYKYLWTEKDTGKIALLAKVRAFFMVYSYEVEEVEE